MTLKICGPRFNRKSRESRLMRHKFKEQTAVEYFSAFLFHALFQKCPMPIRYIRRQYL